MKTMTTQEITNKIFRLLDRVGELAEKAYQAHLKAENEQAKKAA
ncbi:hypothetical protein [Endozoicomonas euniceicola]|uniref:Uncharacterized protein n=1 Tax=Endozoicomonas euniceicola TaxID=1234143 RepID=A0ABY6GPA0_9GAMM|nr:hypothetical protein [Endozoicomonas euniceicola]UYM14244.1 hypothetical protein NX720_15205 [Endozoicomonas euniceicola]